jgi:hypothetical protein
MQLRVAHHTERRDEIVGFYRGKLVKWRDRSG